MPEEVQLEMLRLDPEITTKTRLGSTSTAGDRRDWEIDWSVIQWEADNDNKDFKACKNAILTLISSFQVKCRP
jgi:hypothetical protein